MVHLPGGVTSVGKDGLACDPTALGNEEPHQRRDVLDISQTTSKALALVELNSLRRLLRIEEGCREDMLFKGSEQDGFEGFNIRVSMGPGATALTLMPRGCSSLATPRVKCSTGALEPA